MNDELDPQLLTLFAHSRDPLDDARFLATTLTRIEQQLRLRLMYKAATVVAAIIAAGLLLPWLLEHTALAVSTVWASARRPAEFAASPWAWVASVPIGVFMIVRSVRSRR